MIPTGISTGLIMVRAKVSTQIKNMAPVRHEAGSRVRLSGPTMIRMMWGITNPKKPIIPQTETAAAVINEAKIKMINLKRSTFNPKLSAVVSPIKNKFI